MQPFADMTINNRAQAGTYKKKIDTLARKVARQGRAVKEARRQKRGGNGEEGKGEGEKDFISAHTAEPLWGVGHMMQA